MAAQGSVQDWYTFVGGLNTEGGYFVTPNTSWIDGENVLPKLDGSLARRIGIDYEENYTGFGQALGSNERELYAFTTHKWTSVGGDPNKNFFVVQVGRYVYFFDSASGNISQSIQQFYLNLHNVSTEVPGVTDSEEYPISVTSAFGRLIISGPKMNPLLVTYTPDQITEESLTILIRDFEGFKSYEDIDTELTAAGWDTSYASYGGDGEERATYNLLNQGWDVTKINTYKAANSGLLPANSKSWVYGKDTSDNFDAALLNKQDFGSSPAPKGRFIIDALEPTREYGALSDTVNNTERPTQVAFFAGRVWYSGCLAADFLGKVYFSQVLDTIDKINKCYQVNDPTAEVLSDLLDSDGGVIEIPDAGKIRAMQPLGRGLLVFGEYGVFAISGIDGVFSAANYQVEKVSSVGCVGSKSLVTVEDSIVYWSTQGIYAVSASEGGFAYTARNLSSDKIKTLYKSIPLASKEYAEGVYDSNKKELAWLYSSVFQEDVTKERYTKDTLLIYDTVLGAWHKHTFNKTLGPVAVSIETTIETANEIIDATVVDNLNQTLVDASANEVIAPTKQVKAAEQQYKFLTLSSEDIYENAVQNVEPHTVDNFPAPASYDSLNLTKLDWYYFDGNAGARYAHGIAQRGFYNSAHYFLSGFSQGTAFPSIETIENQPGQFHDARGAYLDTFAHQAFLDNWNFSTGDFGGLENYFTVTDWEVMGMYALPPDYDYMVLLIQLTTAPYTARYYKVRLDNSIIFGSTYSPFTYNQGTLYTWTGSNAQIPGSTSTFAFDTRPSATNGEVWVTAPDNAGDVKYYRHICSTDFDVTTATINSTTFGDNYYGINAGSFSDGRETFFKMFCFENSFYMITKKHPKLFKFGEGVNPASVFNIAGLNTYSELIDFPNTSTGEFLGSKVFDLRAALDPDGNDTVLNEGTVITFYYDSQDNKCHLLMDYLSDRYEYTFGMVLPLMSGVTYQATFSDMETTRVDASKFKDWYSKPAANGGLEQEAYITTGYHMADNGPARQKSGTYLTTFAKRTEISFDDNNDPVNPGGINMQLRWDFTDNYNTGKWTLPVDVYRQIRPYIGEPGTTFDDGYPLVISKNRIRGRGKAVQFKFSSKENHDMQLVGWTGTFVGNTNV